jgi:hypothetical protein
MEPENLISITRFCEYHQVESTFVSALNEFGLVSFVIVEEVSYIPVEQVRNIEKMIRLHYDLDINIEGIEAISHLLNRVDNLHAELTQLRNRLEFYEK